MALSPGTRFAPLLTSVPSPTWPSLFRPQSLIDEWMELPEFRERMLFFFRVAFQ